MSPRRTNEKSTEHTRHPVDRQRKKGKKKNTRKLCFKNYDNSLHKHKQ